MKADAATTLDREVAYTEPGAVVGFAAVSGIPTGVVMSAVQIVGRPATTPATGGFALAVTCEQTSAPRVAAPACSPLEAGAGRLHPGVLHHLELVLPIDHRHAVGGQGGSITRQNLTVAYQATGPGSA